MTETGAPPDFRLDGQLRIRQHGELVNLGPTLLHEVLALLLLRANTPVTVTEIVLSVWPDRDLLDDEFIRPYISRIRRLLRGTDCEVRTLPRRYLLEVDPDRVDVLRFNALLDQADRAPEPRQRQLVEEALLTCPTGDLLAGFTKAWAHTARTEHRLRWKAAVLRRNRYWLQDGLHERLATVLRREKAHRSTDQRIVEDYLLALYRSGNVQEALVHFDRFTSFLRSKDMPVADRLQRLGEAIRRLDPTIDYQNAQATVVELNTLPPPTGLLVGREAELRFMRAHADRDRHDTVRIIGIYGPPGIGKTSLATWFAHKHRTRYAGVLFGHLGAHSASGGGVDAVLGTFLNALGVRKDNLPTEPEARLNRYRDLIRGRPLLVVLDDVASTDEAATLLPTQPGSLMIVTSRNRLTSLTSRHGAAPIVLEPIDEAAALTLLSRLIGDRVNEAPDLISAVAQACNGHPLALCLAGARIATRPEEPIDLVAKAMMDRSQRIPTLDRYAESGDTVAEVFGWSYRLLEPLTANIFRTLGLWPGRSLDLAAIAALTGLDGQRLQDVLADLVRVHLVTPIGTDRFGLLDLLAEYANALAEDIDPPAQRTAALDRLYAHHRAMARAAAACLWPIEVPASPSGPRFEDPGKAREWLDEHRDDLVLATRHALAVRPEHVIDIADCLFRYLDHGGHLAQAGQLHSDEVTAARRVGDDRRTARALGRLGALQVRRGQYDDAEQTLDACRSMYAHLGDLRGEAVALGNLGRIAARRGRFAHAQSHQIEALERFRAIGDRLAEARTLTNLGIVCDVSGDWSAALEHLRAAEAICRKIDAPDARARVLGSIGDVLRAQGQIDAAQQHYEAALAVFQALGDRLGEATTLTNLGLIMAERGQTGDAANLHERALAIFNEIGDEDGVVSTLNNLGAALAAAGRPTAALHHHHEALRRAEAAGNRSEASRANTGLAVAYADQAEQATGRDRADACAASRRYFAAAAAGYRGLGLPEPDALLDAARRLRGL